MFDRAVHFQCEFAMPNAPWFEKTLPQARVADLQGAADLPYVKDTYRVQPDDCIHASTKPGLGCEIDHAILDKLLARVDTQEINAPLIPLRCWGYWHELVDPASCYRS
jgi:hypothetical protein